MCLIRFRYTKKFKDFTYITEHHCYDRRDGSVYMNKEWLLPVTCQFMNLNEFKC